MEQSGTSSSMQSSNGGGGGGDEEYDSRADHSFFNHRINSPISNINPSPLPPQKSHFDHLLFNPNHFDPHHHHNLSDVSLDMVLPNPDLNSSAVAAAAAASASSSLSQRSNHHLKEKLYNNSCNNNSNNGTNNNNNVMRNPRKRSRASRRAPTTVLTTDTSNFRAMVQEFTGIPNPPLMFSGSAPASLFPWMNFHNTNANTNVASADSNKLSLFGLTTSSMLSPPSPYNLLTSSPHKLVSFSPSFGSAPPSISQIMASSAMNRQTPSSGELNTLFNFQSVQPKAFYDSNPERDSQRQNPKRASDILDMMSSSLTTSGPAALVNRSENGDNRNNNINDNINAGYDVESAVEFRSGNNKATENIAFREALRSEGMVESWICASDQAIPN